MIRNTIFITPLTFLTLSCLAIAEVVQLPQTGQTKCYDSRGTEIPCKGTGQDGDTKAGKSWPSPRFTFNDDGTVIDNLTGLMWTKDASAPSHECRPSFVPDYKIELMTWQQALEYVQCLNRSNYLGYNDWRLPNVKELESLMNAGEKSGVNWLASLGFDNVNPTTFEMEVLRFYWSSTSMRSTYTGPHPLAPLSHFDVFNSKFCIKSINYGFTGTTICSACKKV